MKLRALGVVFWLAAALVGALPLARAQVAPLEASVKAAYLYKFTGFVDWPLAAFAGAEAPLVIGVAGADAVFAELVPAIAGRSVQGHPLLARQVNEGDSLDGLHVLFVGGPTTARRRSWLQPLAARPVLLVGDGADDPPPGSALNFVIVDGRVRFEASLRAAERAGLRLSARLLAVAERVLGAP